VCENACFSSLNYSRAVVRRLNTSKYRARILGRALSTSSKSAAVKTESLRQTMRKERAKTITSAGRRKCGVRWKLVARR